MSYLVHKSNCTWKGWLSIVLIVTGCHVPEARHNGITKIEVATGSCFGPCQKTAVSIDSTLAYKYYGGEILFPLPPGKSDNLNGYYTGTVSRSLWDVLNSKLEAIHYQQLDTVYKRSVDDQSLEVIIHYQGSTKHIRAQSASLPNNVREVFYWIARSYKQVKIKPSKDTFQFGTTLQQ